MQIDDAAPFAASPLAALQDIDGVVGSMLVGHDGALMMSYLPPGLTARAGEAAPRLAVLLEALSAGHHAQAFSLRFAEHRLLVQPLVDTFLCAVTELRSSSAMVKMALNVLGRQLQ